MNEELERRIRVVKASLRELQFQLSGFSVRQRVAISDSFWSDLDVEIGEASKDLFEKRFFAHAVLEALKVVENAVNGVVRIRNKEKEDFGVSLMTNAFSPTPKGGPIITLSDQSTLSGEGKQLGFMYLFAGAVGAIRNPLAHKNLKPDELDEFSAKHSLYIASFLMKELKRGLREYPWRSPLENERRRLISLLRQRHHDLLSKAFLA